MVDAVASEVEAYFAASPLGRQVYDAVAALVDEMGPATVRVSRSQVAFRRRRGFCWIWLPGRYLSHPGAEVVLSCALGRQDPDPRWKEVVQVGGGRWMHHLEMRASDDIDRQVAAWLAEAYQQAR